MRGEAYHFLGVEHTVALTVLAGHVCMAAVLKCTPQCAGKCCAMSELECECWQQRFLVYNEAQAGGS